MRETPFFSTKVQVNAGKASCISSHRLRTQHEQLESAVAQMRAIRLASLRSIAAILVLFLCAVPAFSQGVRFAPSPINTTATVFTTTVIVPVTASTISFCAAPASGVPCVNKATTYTDSTLTSACSTATQVVLDGTSSCVAAPDALGNWGIWAAPGQYAYTITTSGGASLGPFYVTLALPRDASKFLTSAYTNATTTFSSVTNMSWPLEANKNYKLSCDITWQGTAATTGPKFQLTGPAAPTAVILNLDSAVTATTSIYASAVAFSSAVANSGVITTATNLPAQVTAEIVNGANAGTLTLQAAANGVGTLTIQPGSACTLQ